MSLRVHALVHFESSVIMLRGRTTLFGITLSNAALLGVVGEAAYPPVKFIPALWSGWHLPIMFLKGVFQTPYPFGKTFRSQLRS